MACPLTESEEGPRQALKDIYQAKWLWGEQEQVTYLVCVSLHGVCLNVIQFFELGSVLVNSCTSVSTNTWTRSFVFMLLPVVFVWCMS